MAITTTIDWTVSVDEDYQYCMVHKFVTKTELRDDEAFHKGTTQEGWARIRLDDLPAYMRERKIKAFSNYDDMRLIWGMPVED